MGGHGAPSQASARTTPPRSWGGPAICALCLRRWGWLPNFFFTHPFTPTYAQLYEGQLLRSGAKLNIFFFNVEESPSIFLSSLKEGTNQRRCRLFSSRSAKLCPSFHSLSMKYQLFPLLSSRPSLPSHWRTMRGCVFLGVADWLAEIVHIAHCLCPDFVGRKSTRHPPLKDNVWIIQRSNNFSPKSFSSNSRLRFEYQTWRSGKNRGKERLPVDGHGLTHNSS